MKNKHTPTEQKKNYIVCERIIEYAVWQDRDNGQHSLHVNMQIQYSLAHCHIKVHKEQGI